MQTIPRRSTEEDVRSFIEEYFASWTGTDEDKILAYYSDDIVLHVPPCSTALKLVQISGDPN